MLITCYKELFCVKGFFFFSAVCEFGDLIAIDYILYCILSSLSDISLLQFVHYSPPCNFYFSRFHHFVFETACYCLKIRTQWRLFRDDCRKCGRFSNILILLYLIFVLRKLDLMYILVKVAFKHVVIKKKFISIGKIIMSLFVYVLGRGDIWKSKPRGKKFFYNCNVYL